jgi:hypothetical protein
MQSCKKSDARHVYRVLIADCAFNASECPFNPIPELFLRLLRTLLRIPTWPSPRPFTWRLRTEKSSLSVSQWGYSKWK